MEYACHSARLDAQAGLRVIWLLVKRDGLKREAAKRWMHDADTPVLARIM